MMSQHDMSYAEWQETLYQKIALGSQCSGTDIQLCDWFWIVDGTAHPSLPKVFWELDSEPKALPLYMNTYVEESINSGPWFLPCNIQSKVTHWLFNQSINIPIGFLASVKRGYGDTFFEHLQNVLECRLLSSTENNPSKTKPGIFRYYDPRILYNLMTYHEDSYILRVKGPATSIHIWEPGRQIAISKEFNDEDSYFCDESLLIPEDLIEYLWRENKIYTVIGTLGGKSGEVLRRRPLADAYSYVENIDELVSPTGYSSPRDLGFATACSLLAPTDKWKFALQYITDKHITDFDSLEEAYKHAGKELLATQKN